MGKGKESFSLGGWLVEPTLDRISSDCTVVQLRPRAMDVLVALAAASGDLATKRELIDAVWRTEFVSEHALTQVIAELRAALGDKARDPTYIENIPRKGYRLVAPVTYVEQTAAPVREMTLPIRLQGQGVEYSLNQGSNVIGRTAEAAVCIDRTEVSRCHARILVQGTTATLEDLGSKNGTFLNGQRLQQPAVLADGDEIWIGRSVARFRYLVEGEPTQTEHSVT
jgi:DNA-binding winged helix-turn-helix (wHTH) protein